MKELLDKASKAYYEGEPIMSDEEFDRLAQEQNYLQVGYETGSRHEHYKRMYSLQKVYQGEDSPFDVSTGPVVVTPKLDGAAISILYRDGKLLYALTRGDGVAGIDITEKVSYLVPTSIELAGIVQITGEVVCPRTLPNARNLASGSLNLKDIEEFRSRPLNFIAYDIYPYLHDRWSSCMTALTQQGFSTVLDNDWNEYPHDGKVFRIDNVEEFTNLGYTARHPRGAYALKEQKEGVVTKLLKVEWNVGKSGVVTPVAILEPVLVDDAMVSRATLHNFAFIQSMNLEIGCDVEIIRSGEIIPKILRRVDGL